MWEQDAEFDLDADPDDGLVSAEGDGGRSLCDEDEPIWRNWRQRRHGASR